MVERQLFDCGLAPDLVTPDLFYTRTACGARKIDSQSRRSFKKLIIAIAFQTSVLLIICSSFGFFSTFLFLRIVLYVLFKKKNNCNDNGTFLTCTKSNALMNFSIHSFIFVIRLEPLLVLLGSLAFYCFGTLLKHGGVPLTLLV